MSNTNYKTIPPIDLFCSNPVTSPLLILHRLLQRYQNVKAELEAQQNLERIRMEKMVQSGGLTSTFSGSASKKSKSGKRNSHSAS